MFINSDTFCSGMTFAFQQPSENPIKHRFTDFGKWRIPVAEWLIQVRDAYNLEYAYQMIHDWAVEEGLGSSDNSRFGETYFVQREHPTRGKEIWIRWRLERPPTGAKGGLFTYSFDLDWKIIGLKKTEIAWKGQKIKADRSEFELKCKAAILIDKENAWENSIFKNFKELYTKRVLRNKITMHRKKVYSYAYRLRDLVMYYLKQETYLSMKEGGDFYVTRMGE